MITTLDQNDMEKIAKDWILENITLYQNMKHKYIQRNDFKFPLDMKDLEEISHLDPHDVESRFATILRNAAKLPEKQRKEVMKKVEEQYLTEVARAAKHEIATKLLRFLIEQPEAMIKQLNAALLQLGDEEKEDYYPPEFEILNLESRSINALNYDRLGKLVSVGGWIAYLENPPHIEYQEKYYKCPACGTAKLYSGTPKSCASCGYAKALEFDASQSKGEKVQELYVMENYEEVFQADSNGTEGLISVLVTGNNINRYQIGDRVRVTGIVQLMKKKVLAYLAIKAMGVQIDGNAHLDISKEEMAQIDAISKDPFKFIRDNFASSIIGEKYDIIKESLALAIAGGADSEKRKNIHILMVGNPGAGKSELLKAVEKDSPKAFYVSDASGPGLTAAITDIGGSRVMIPGILPLANNGVACLDELDKMKREDTQAMHSAMEQGEFMKSKAGLKMKFTTRTTIIAAANPVNSSFDANRTILEQITLPESLLQRFDVVWILLDDGNLDPEAILSSTEKSDNAILKKYFSYIQRINPDISPVTKEISHFFNELRGKSGDLALNARMLLSMKRLVQASAKMHLRNQASIEDFQEMEKIITSYLQYFNFSITNITLPGSLKDLVWRLQNLFRTQKQWKRDELLHQSAMPEDEFDRCIDMMKNRGEIYEKPNGRYELI